MGVILKKHHQTHKTITTIPKIVKMLRFIFIAMTAFATLSEAAPGGGYYWPKNKYYYEVYAKKSKSIDASPATKTADVGDLVDVAVAAGSFTTLVKLVTDLDLVETLKGIEAATVFAPSDDAFARLPEGTLESLTPEQAKAIVARHVIAGATVKAADVTTGSV